MFPDELYDWQDDPRETTNCFDDPNNKDIVEDLTAELDQFLARYTVPGHSGPDLGHQPKCTEASLWLMAAKPRKL